MTIVRELENACVQLYEDGVRTVTAHDVARQAGVDNIDYVNDILWLQTRADRRACEITAINIKPAGARRGPPTYLLTSWAEHGTSSSGQSAADD